MTDNSVQNFAQSLNYRDLEQAQSMVEQFRALQEVPLRDLLEKFHETISNDELGTSRRILTEIESRYGERSANEQKLLKQAEVAQDVTSSRNEFEEYRQFMAAQATTNIARIQFSLLAESFLRNAQARSIKDLEKLEQVINSLKQQEERLKKTSDNTEEILEPSSLPPSLSFLDVTVPDVDLLTSSSINIPVTLANVGGDPAFNVQVNVTSRKNLDISPQSVEFGDIAPNEDTDLEFEIDNLLVGSHSIRFNATADDVNPARVRRELKIRKRPLLSPIGDFSHPPTDPDGDGVYEDINGDGKFNFDDIMMFFEHRNDRVISQNPELFDFDGDGKIGLQDVIALFVDWIL